MITKYKISELAKDFDIKPNAVIDVIQAAFGVKKARTAILEEDELNMIFEKFTLEHNVESLDAYFELKSPEGEKPAEPKTKAKAKEKAEEKAEEPAKEAPAEEKPAEEKPAKSAGRAKKPAAEKEEKPEPKAEKKPAEKKAEEKKPAEKKPAEPKTEKPAEKPGRKSAMPKMPVMPQNKPQPPKKKNSDKPVQPRTKGEQTTVNLRSNNVDLEKYNEKYENIAPASTAGVIERGVSKQKINQKSKQYNKRGGHQGKRETEKERLARIAAERAKKPQLQLKIPDEITVGELASMLRMTAAEVIKKLFSLGQMATINDTLDYDTAAIVAEELGAKVEKLVVVAIEDRIIDLSEDDEADLVKRDPVVVVMGHVDHGKTSILDAVRHTSVTSSEAGGITQHIGAYRVNINGSDITFLDTPGHAAFTSMRLRGAMATDIAILVVAADDGIMPQTIEAINHAKAAGVQIIVAINKMDKPEANPDRVLQQLTEYELVPEEWGGDTICVPVSALTKQGIDKLLESVLLVAEMLELKANPDRSAKGVVIEARLDKGRGPIATLLVQNGTLKAGDTIVAGNAVGRVRVMTDDKGRKVNKAGPSVPVEIMGLAEVPQAGDTFDAVSDERLARELVEQRKAKAKEEQFKEFQKVTLENLFDSIKDGELKELNIIIKADVQGSAEAVKQSLVKLSNDEVRVKVIHAGVGAVSESDVMLAAASNAIIVGFNVRPDHVAAENAERDGIELRCYRVIYDCINDVEAAIKGMLAPKFRDVDIGQAEVRQVVKISSVGNIAGCYVTTGKVTRNAKVRVVRDGIVVAEDEMSSLRRFKDDVKEVAKGFECGIGLNKFNDIKEGDVFECYITEEYRD